ncbi:MAG TPA: hypothetical protein VIJ24_00400, partial [Verrucomicrobiae bacterium]
MTWNIGHQARFGNLMVSYFPPVGAVERITRIKYHVVAGLPSGISQPSSSRRPRMGPPIGRAAPS